MIRVGMQVHVSLMCNGCGKPMTNAYSAPQSAFWFCSCQNPECEDCGFQVVVEKASGMIVGSSPSGYEWCGQRLYPVLVTKEGLQSFPDDRDAYHLYRPAKVYEDGCAVCGEKKDFHKHKAKP